jgi:hypothetical protein
MQGDTVHLHQVCSISAGISITNIQTNIVLPWALFRPAPHNIKWNLKLQTDATPDIKEKEPKLLLLLHIQIM